MMHLNTYKKTVFLHHKKFTNAAKMQLLILFTISIYTYYYLYEVSSKFTEINLYAILAYKLISRRLCI